MTDQALVQYEKYQDLFQDPKVLAMFERTLDERHGNFVAAAIAVINENNRLTKCTPASLLTACLQAAAHDLSVHPQAGQAWIIPYGDKAKFQLGYKGLAHMALRTGQYAVLNTGHLSGSEEVEYDKLTGKVSGIVGVPDGNDHSVFSYFKLHDGREGLMVWTLERIHAHAEKYSKAYKKKDSPWQDKEHGVKYMERKTVLLQNLKQNNGPLAWFPPGVTPPLDEFPESNGDKLEEVIEAQVRDIGMDPELEDEPLTADEVTGEIELTIEDEYWTLARGLDQDPAEAEKKAKEILARSSDDFEIALETVKARVK